MSQVLPKTVRHGDPPVLSSQVTAMSVRLHFLSPGDAAGAVGTVGRSASFAGFSAQSRRVS